LEKASKKNHFSFLKLKLPFYSLLSGLFASPPSSISFKNPSLPSPDKPISKALKDRKNFIYF